jgi:predicted metal-binding membrane protein
LRLDWYHPEWTLGVVTVLAWAVLVLAHSSASSGAETSSAMPDMPGMEHGGIVPSTPPTVSAWAAAAGLWLVMAVAMMLPSLRTAMRTTSLTSRWTRRHRAAWVLAAAYLTVWAIPGLVVVTALWVVPWRPPVWMAGALLLAAAAWVVTPMRRAALAACHRVQRVPGQGRRADAACVREGVRLGLACVGTCWLIMLAATLATHDLLLMAALTVVGVAEKVVEDRRRRLPPWTAGALVLLGLGVLAL